MTMITPALCGELAPSASASSAAAAPLRLASSDAVSRCVLLMGLLDRQPRQPPAASSASSSSSASSAWPPTPAPPSPLPTRVPPPPEIVALRAQTRALAQFAPINDFFLFKLVDAGGLFAFAGLGLALLVVFLDTVTSFLPTSSTRGEYRRGPQQAVYAEIASSGAGAGAAGAGEAVFQVCAGQRSVIFSNHSFATSNPLNIPV
jgi:hypothetical protein